MSYPCANTFCDNDADVSGEFCEPCCDVIMAMDLEARPSYLFEPTDDEIADDLTRKPTGTTDDF